MVEIQVKYRNINEAIKDLRSLEKRAAKYSKNMYTMNESAGAGAAALLDFANEFAEIAKAVENLMSETAEKLQMASDTFQEMDEGLANAMAGKEV